MKLPSANKNLTAFATACLLLGISHPCSCSETKCSPPPTQGQKWASGPRAVPVCYLPAIIYALYNGSTTAAIFPSRLVISGEVKGRGVVSGIEVRGLAGGDYYAGSNPSGYVSAFVYSIESNLTTLGVTTQVPNIRRAGAELTGAPYPTKGVNDCLASLRGSAVFGGIVPVHSRVDGPGVERELKGWGVLSTTVAGCSVVIPSSG